MFLKLVGDVRRTSAQRAGGNLTLPFPATNPVDWGGVAWNGTEIAWARLPTVAVGLLRKPGFAWIEVGTAWGCLFGCHGVAWG